MGIRVIALAAAGGRSSRPAREHHRPKYSIAKRSEKRAIKMLLARGIWKIIGSAGWAVWCACNAAGPHTEQTALNLGYHVLGTYKAQSHPDAEKNEDNLNRRKRRKRRQMMVGLCCLCFLLFSPCLSPSRLPVNL
jgi:hypothetical protein